MNFGDFKTQVASTMSRDAATFNVGGIDLLALAVNQARKFAESQVDFEFSKREARLPGVVPTSGAVWTDIVDETAAPLSVKGIQAAWTADSSWQRLKPVTLLNREAYQNRLKRRNRAWDPMVRNQEPATEPIELTMVLHGTKLKVYPQDNTDALPNPSNFLLDVVVWQDDYVDADDTDFFLVEGHTWLLFQSIIQLNYYLKEDQRVAINAQAVDQAWKALLRWNGTLVASRTESYNLD